MARWAGVPPRPPYSLGHWMPAKPASALSASHLRRISKPASPCDRQKPRCRHSAGRLSASQARNSVRNCSSASLKVRSTCACPLLLVRVLGNTEPHSVLGGGRQGTE